MPLTLRLDQKRPDSVPDRIRARAAETPGAPAVVAGKRVLTYGRLDTLSSRLADRLRSLGVGPDVVVPLCLVGSPALVVGALGILKAGGAYLPLDPSHPRERLSRLLCDASPRVVVAAACLASGLPSGSWRVIGLDPEGVDAGPEPARHPAVPVTPDSLAYVIYTSGSTGHPKGVEIAHGALMNLVRWHQRAFGVTADDRATQIAGVGFDAAVWEMWPYLTAGASVHIPDEAARQDPERLRDWLVAEGITLSFVPTPLAERMMTLPWPEGTRLRALLTGADTLHRYPPSGLPFEVVNNYGPTECAVVATSGVVRPGVSGTTLPPIGRAIDGVRVYLLDEALRPVPAGSPGEIVIGGAGVGVGYLGRRDLTAERFVDDPFSRVPGARLYRTGDLGRMLPDGQILFLGRKDEQIKIRGHRVEPAEIVTAIDLHPEVVESAVVASANGGGDARLVAYVVPARKASLTASALREFLAARLPDFMVPGAFVSLEALPLNSSGKVDRDALPAPGAANVLRDHDFVEPRTPIEERVAAVLAPLLRLERVGVRDNFFLLGGHSLLGTQLIARLRQIYSVDLPLRTIFEAPTVEGLAQEIERLLVAKLQSLSEEEVAEMTS